MAFDHLHFNEAGQYGRLLRQFLDKAEQSDDEFADVRDVMIQMRDGGDNAADTSNYAEVVRRFGFGDWDPTKGDPPSAEFCNAARAAFLELDSAFNKTSGNGPVSDVRAARDQLFAKLRG